MPRTIAELLKVADAVPQDFSDCLGENSVFDEFAALIAALSAKLRESHILIAEYEEREEALMNKLGDNCCACSVDKKTDVCSVHAPLVTELSAKLRESEWQPIETALKGVKEILVYDEDSGRYALSQEECMDDRRSFNYRNGAKATHWMPLPTPPKKEQ